MDYFDQLSADISEDWTRLADKLKLGRAAVQRISQLNAAHHHVTAAERCRRCARDTLVQWFRSSAKSHDRVTNSVIYSLFCSIITSLQRTVFLV